MTSSSEVAIETVAILDAGAQYGKLIDRRIRELGVHCELVPLDISAEEVMKANYKGLVISGGPASLSSAANPSQIMDPALLELGIRIFGICYGR